MLGVNFEILDQEILPDGTRLIKEASFESISLIEPMTLEELCLIFALPPELVDAPNPIKTQRAEASFLLQRRPGGF